MSSAKGWVEVRVAVPLGWQELVADALALGPCTTVAMGATSIATEPAPLGQDYVRAFFPSEEDSPALRAELEASLGRLSQAVGDEELGALLPRFLVLPPEDYATSWRKSWRSFRLRRGGRELVLLAPWDEERLAQQEAGSLLLRIEPGSSFGSGRHATTRTCLGVLMEGIRGGERLLDAGTGSGILAVVASQLGAAHCLGLDIDPASQAAAETLAQDNGAAANTRFVTGALEDLDPDAGPFDWVVANIYSDILQAQARPLAERLVPGGRFLFSGCPQRHRAATELAVERAGLEIEELRQRGRWITFIGRRSQR